MSAVSTTRSSPATLKDVAALAGVSLATASRVLNGRSDTVRTERRARVLAASVELGYVPNAQAQSLARSTSSTVGLIVHDIDDPYFSAIARGAMERATLSNLLLLICSNHRDPQRELQYLASLSAQRVRAVILAGSAFDSSDSRDGLLREVKALAQLGVRMACVTDHHIDVDTVLADNRGGAARLGRLLVDLGHREFGVISGPSGLTTTRHRLEGLRAALHEAGLTLSEDRVIEGGFSRDGGYSAATELLLRAPQITALVALNDVMAVGALASLRDAGIKVPDGVSLAGFDDIQLASDVYPTLTTVRVPMCEMGRQATELVLDEQPEASRRVHLPTEVVARASTGRPPS